MPRINEGLTKLKIMSSMERVGDSIDSIKYSKDKITIQTIDNFLKIADSFESPRTKALLFDPLYKISDDALGELAETKSGHYSLLKALKTEQARMVVKNLDTSFNKSKSSLDNLYTICDYDMFLNSDKFKNAHNKILDVYKNVNKNVKEKEIRVFVNSLKTSSIEMLSELFKKFGITSEIFKELM